MLVFGFGLGSGFGFGFGFGFGSPLVKGSLLTGAAVGTLPGVFVMMCCATWSRKPGSRSCLPSHRCAVIHGSSPRLKGKRIMVPCMSMSNT